MNYYWDPHWNTSGNPRGALVEIPRAIGAIIWITEGQGFESVIVFHGSGFISGSSIFK